VKTKLLLAIALIGIAAFFVWNAALHRRQAEASVKEAKRAAEAASGVRAAIAEAPAAAVPAEVDPVETLAEAPAAAEQPTVIPPAVKRPIVQVRRPTQSVTAPKQNAVMPAMPAPQPKRRELADPVARIALSLVGADPEAEAYWVEAINDPSLSAHERSDLIEDLNEEGFEDPHHPTFEDLPIILSRLELLEELAPVAMDEVNSEAIWEAAKDLAKMALIAGQN
jgi:cytoskeletal protein RodZ